MEWFLSYPGQASKGLSADPQSIKASAMAALTQNQEAETGESAKAIAWHTQQQVTRGTASHTVGSGVTHDLHTRGPASHTVESGVAHNLHTPWKVGLPMTFTHVMVHQ